MRRRGACTNSNAPCVAPRFELAAARLATIVAVLLAAGPALAECATDHLPAGRRVAELQTSLGEVCIELLDRYGEAPDHVENFLWYLTNDELDDTFFHRHAEGFVLQGADFRIRDDELSRVEPRPDHIVINEPCEIDTTVEAPGGPQPACSVRGNEAYTVALAKVAGDPDSGTTSWFVNLSDNRGNLDNQNGGFTVFGRITDPDSRAAIDKIALTDHVSPVDHAHKFWVGIDEFNLLGQPLPVIVPVLDPPVVPAPPSYPAFTPTDFGCNTMDDQATLLQEDLSNLLFEPYVPYGETPIYETVGAACGTPFVGSLASWTPQPGPPSCPDLDRIAIRTIEPTAATGLFPTVPTPFEYVTYTCEQLEEAVAARDAYKQANRDHFYGQFAPNLVYIEDATVRPLPEPSSSSAAGAALAAFAWLRNRKRARRSTPDGRVR